MDYYLHENPELKRFAYWWLADFVGWLPMPEGGDRESYLTADYNAEMIEHIARYPRVRDLALFVGNPDDTFQIGSETIFRSFGNGPRSTICSRATSRASTRVLSRIAGRFATTSVTFPTRSSVSSPSVARESVRVCYAD